LVNDDLENLLKQLNQGIKEVLLLKGCLFSSCIWVLHQVRNNSTSERHYLLIREIRLSPENKMKRLKRSGLVEHLFS
jgi:hypothetical protein